MRIPALVAVCFALLPCCAHAGPASGPFGDLRWRPVGPLRGGRTKAVTGVPGRPGVFYLGAVNGGVFKSDDFGRTWTPIFDDQPTGSIGALAVAPSNPDVLYVGSGEGLHRPDLSTGDGMYKSTDGGKSFRHLGLRDGQQISQIAVDPKNADRLFVAVLGHPYGPNDERGIYRSLDGGESFQRVLHLDSETGGSDVVIDPSNPQIVFATLWEAREGPWENAEFAGPGSGLYKSTDGGTTWRKLEKGLPTFAADGLGRIALAIAPSSPSRMYAAVLAKKKGGVYRSDDAGESWTRAPADERVVDRDDLSEVRVHPKNPDIVFTNAEVVWKSVDGGQTFNALRGAPGGDDYAHVWISPDDPETMIIGSDQGAIVTVNGGRTFSSWYNQPTAQMFHVTADNSFPYRLCGGQQDSGSACVSSRGPDGQITAREWHPAAFEEYGYAAPDPLDPNIIFGGRLSRTDLRTGQVQDVSPELIPNQDYRIIRTQPVVFSPHDPHLLYFASNTLWQTTDRGESWKQLSPDLTRKTWDVPASVSRYKGTDQAKVTQRGVIYAVAPSPLDAQLIWAGTDDGLIHVTKDGGKSWQDVTPPVLTPWAKVSVLEASHSDAQTAYAAINTLRLDVLQPQILRTRDGGKTWSSIVAGLPPGAPVNVVREDPIRKGLLYCGSELSVSVSFDDGDHWQPLRLNMPATSVRDLIVKGDDLAIATHGRGFYILDDLTPLRQWEPAALSAPAHLFQPQPALRIRWNTNSDTPLPPDEPALPNPPDGAIIDYHLSAAASGPVVIDILDGDKHVVRHYSSATPAEPLRDEGNIPRYWIRPPQIPSAEAGLHRFVWDLHYPQPAVAEPSFPIAAIVHDTPREPRGPWVAPGTYQVRLSIGDKSLTQPLEVRMDPRIKTPLEGLVQQRDLSMRVAAASARTAQALQELRELRKGASAELLQKLLPLDPPPAENAPRHRRGGAEEATLPSISATLGGLLSVLQQADAAPRATTVALVEETLKKAEALLAAFAVQRKK